MPSDDVTPFFNAQNGHGSSTTNSTHTSVVDMHIDNGVRYVRIDPPPSKGSGGWVDGLNSSKNRISLCEYTKVKLLKRAGGMISFCVLDGNIKEATPGTVLSMHEENAKNYLRKDKREGEILITVSNFESKEYVESVQRSNQPLLQSSGQVQCGTGLTAPVTLSTLMKNGKIYKPLPAGTYKLMAPDAAHSKEYTSQYRPPNKPDGQFDQVWFPIEYGDDSRYLHVGHVSDGCVTVVNINDWESIYHKIICCRSDGDSTDKIGGGKYVGRLTVQEKPNHRPTNSASTPHRLSSF